MPKLQENTVFALFLVLILSILTACPAPQQYSNIPNIEFKQLALKDSSDLLGNKNKIYTLLFKVIDGDGNIGLKESDTSGVFAPGELYSNNLFTTLYEISNGDTLKLPPEKQRNFRIPYIQPQGQYKTLIADIYVNIAFAYNNEGALPYDSVFFEFYLIDRDFAQSNIQKTPVLRLDTTGIFTANSPE